VDAQKNILLLDSDAQSAQQILNSLGASEQGFNVSHLPDISSGITYLENSSPDLVLLDGNLIGTDNFASVKNMLAESQVPYILLSDLHGGDIIEQLEQAGAKEYLIKGRITPFYLLKTILSTLRLSETESRLNQALEEYSGRIEAFSLMLEFLDEGLMVISREGAIQYANNRAITLLKDERIKSLVSGHLAYRRVQNEEVIELEGNDYYRLSVRVNNFLWNGEHCNLFLIEKQESAEFTKSKTDAFEVIIPLLNAIERNILLIKDDKVQFVNAQAAKILLLNDEELNGKWLHEVIVAGEGQYFASAPNHGTNGTFRMPNGNSLEAEYIIRDLNIDNQAWRLIMFERKHAGGDNTPENFDSHSNTSIPATDPISRKLREPAGNLLNDVQLIAYYMNNGMFQKANEHAGQAEEALGKMEKVLVSFKDYLAVNESEPHRTEFSMKALAEEVLQNMKPQLDALEAEINISELPVINADRSLVKKLLACLVDNTIKFRRPNKKPVIDIGHDAYDGNVIFCVRDNGIGISRKDHEKVFELFERLGESEQPGNGIGLAISKKIAALHNGKIWVESLPGHGSNFYFILK
jgi:DNA-binding NarL/FixJ family response regulator